MTLNLSSIQTLLHKMSVTNPKVVIWQSLYKVWVQHSANLSLPVLACLFFIMFLFYQTVYSALCIRDTIRAVPQPIQLFSEISRNFTDDLFYIATCISKVVRLNNILFSVVMDVYVKLLLE